MLTRVPRPADSKARHEREDQAGEQDRAGCVTKGKLVTAQQPGQRTVDHRAVALPLVKRRQAGVGEVERERGLELPPLGRQLARLMVPAPAQERPCQRPANRAGDGQWLLQDRPFDEVVDHLAGCHAGGWLVGHERAGRSQRIALNE